MIIALLGPNSCGKTSTLNIVYDTLISHGAVSSSRQQQGANRRDFSDILIWKGKKIAFFTMGDQTGPILDAIIIYQSCEYFICASNINRVKPQRELRRLGATIIQKNQNPPANQSADDNRVAQIILNLIP